MSSESLWYRLLAKGAWEIKGYSNVGGAECRAFTPPHQLICEAVCIVPLCLLVARSASSKLRTLPPPRHCSGFFAASLQLGLAYSLVQQIIMKCNLGTLLFLLQPCHVGSALFVHVLSGGNIWSVALALSTGYGYFIALLSPDPGVLADGWFLFYVQHVLLGVLVPCFIVTTRKDVRLMCTDWRWRVLVACSAQLYHWVLLAPVDYVSGVNVNYMLCPPPIVDGWPAWAQPFYRPVISAASFILSQVFLQLTTLVVVMFERMFGWVLSLTPKLNRQTMKAA